MMEEKRQIILDYGTPVQVLHYDGTLLYDTIALIGKATKQFMSEISMEYHRKAQVIPEVGVQNGHIFHNTVTDEYFLTLATMNEVIGSELVCRIARLVECNNTAKIVTQGETADDYGNITTGDVTRVDNLKIHIEAVTAELRQFDPGLHPNAKYRIYAPSLPVDLLDTISLTVGGRPIKLKVESLDYISFEGIVLIDVSTETRV